MTTLDTFQPFPKLPTELRLKIWKLALPGPQVLEVEWYDTREKSLPTWTPIRDRIPNMGTYNSTQPSLTNSGWIVVLESFSISSSGLWSTCRESRAVFLKDRFPIGLRARDKFMRHLMTRCCVFFNPKIDTLFISGFQKDLIPEMRRLYEVLECFREVRYLALDSMPFQWFTRHGIHMRPFCLLFFLLPRLEKITLVCGDSSLCHYHGRCPRHKDRAFRLPERVTPCPDPHPILIPDGKVTICEHLTVPEDRRIFSRRAIATLSAYFKDCFPERQLPIMEARLVRRGGELRDHVLWPPDLPHARVRPGLMTLREIELQEQVPYMDRHTFKSTKWV